MLAGVMAYGAFLAAGGLPLMDWISGDVISISGLVGIIVVGLATSRLYTRSQVDGMREDHLREVTNMKERYEQHLTRTVDYYKFAVETAVERENNWRKVAEDWQKVVNMLGEGFDPLHEQSNTILTIIREMQLRSRPPSGRSR